MAKVGQVQKKLEAPLSREMMDAYGVSLRSRDGKSNYFAVLMSHSRELGEQSIFYLFDNEDKLVYQEVIPKTAG